MAVVIEEQESGSASGSSVTTDSSLAVDSAHKYIAFTSSKASRVTTSVVGMGLTWTVVEDQCSGRDQTRIAIFEGTGTPSSGTITANFDGTGEKLIVVYRLSGVDGVTPILVSDASNTNGEGSPSCSGGTDDDTPILSLDVQEIDSLILGAINRRSATFTPGTGYVTETDVEGGSGGDITSISIESKTSTTTGATDVDASLSSAQDWSMVAIELNAEGAITETFIIDAKLIKDGQTKAFTIDATLQDPNECPHQFVEVTTDQTHTGDTNFTDIPGAVIDSSFFVTGRKYLIVVTTQAVGSNINTNYGVTTLHGSTGFDGAEHVFEPNAVATRSQYSYHNVWTAVASEGIKMQFETMSAGQTVKADQTTLFALDLDKFTEGVDWHSSQIVATTTLATTPSTANNATVTFTPPVAGNDWLVISGGCVDTDALNVNYISRTARSGEVTSTTPSTSQEGEDAPLDLYVQTLFRVFNLGNASNTFEQEAFKSDTQGPAATREYSSIFAINLNKFSSHSNVYTDGGITLDTTDDLSTSTEVQTDTLAPSIAGKTWILGSFVTGGNAFQEIRARMQVDNVDQVPTQTSDNYKQLLGYDPIDENNWALQTVEDLDTSSHTTDIDVTAETGSPSDRTAKFRSIFELRLSKLAPTVKTKPFTIDVLLQATQTKIFTIDSILAGTEEFDVNAILIVPNAETFTVDALLQVTQIFNFTIDAFLQKTQIKAFTINAILQATQTKVFTVDSILRAENAINFTVDGLIEASPEKMFLIDALLQDTFIEDFEVNSIVVERNTETFTVDSIVVDRNVEDFLVDAKIVRIELFDVDAKVINRNTEDFEVDAFLQDTFTENFLVDALLKALQQVFNFTVDALPQDQFTKSFLVDAIFKATFTEDFTVDGCIRLRVAKTFIIDSQLEPKKLFCDFFNRPDNIALGNSDIPGNAWIEIETVPGVGAEIVNNRMEWLSVQNSNNRNEPVITNNFTKQTSGKLKWQFQFDFDNGTDLDYRLTMQLGEAALLIDPNTSQTTGVAVNFQYISKNRGMTSDDAVGHGFEPSPVEIGRVSGLVTVDITADFGTQTYNINLRGAGLIAGQNLTTGIPFVTSVGIDTIRIYSDLLSAISFVDKKFDDMCVFEVLETTESFEVDAVLQKTQEEQFTVDALIQDTFTEIFSLDGLRSAAPDKFFLIDVFLQAEQTKDFTIDVILSSRIPFGFTVDSILQATFTKDFTIDSCLRKEQQETVEVDAVLAEIKTKDFIVDGFLTETPIAEFIVNSLLEQEQTINFITDAFVAQGTVKNFLIDVGIKALDQVELFEVGAKTKATQTEGFTVDALLKEEGNTIEFTVDSQLVGANTETFTLDSHLRAVQTKTFEIDSILNLENTEIFTIDGRIAVTRNFTVDAFIALVKQFTVGPLLKGAQTKDFQVNGITFIPPAVLICVDARLRVRNDKDFAVDAGLETTNTKEFVVDGLPEAVQTKDFTVDSKLTDEFLKSFIVDARVIAVPTENFTIDAKIAEANTKLFEVDAKLQRRRVTGFNVDGFLQIAGVNTITFGLDAIFPEFGKTATFTVDTVFARQQFNNRTIDALLKELGRTFEFTLGARTLGIQTETFSVNAILKAEFTTNFRVDGISFIPPAITIAIGPIIQFTAVEGIEVDSKLIVRKDTSFSIDAVIALTVTNTKDFDVDANLLLEFNTFDFTVDSSLFLFEVKTFSLNAVLNRVNTRSVLIDATDLHFTFTEDFDVDAIFEGATLSTTFSVDSDIFATQTESIDINALIATRKTTEFSVDAITFILPSRSFLVHGFPKAFNQTADFILEAHLRLVQTTGFSVGAIIFRPGETLCTGIPVLMDDFTTDAGWDNNREVTIQIDTGNSNIMRFDNLFSQTQIGAIRAKKELDKPIDGEGDILFEFDHLHLQGSTEFASNWTIDLKKTLTDVTTTTSDEITIRYRVFSEFSQAPERVRLEVYGKDGSGPIISSGTNLDGLILSDNKQYFPRIQKIGSLVTLSLFLDAERTIHETNSPKVIDVSSLDMNDTLSVIYFGNIGSGGSARLANEEFDNLSIFGPQCPSPRIDSFLQAEQIEDFTVDAKVVRLAQFEIDAFIQRLGVDCRSGILLSDNFSSDNAWTLTSTGNTVLIDVDPSSGGILNKVKYNSFGNFVNGRYYKQLSEGGGLGTINTLEDFRMEFEYNRDSIALSGVNGPHLMGLTNNGGIMRSQQFFGVQANRTTLTLEMRDLVTSLVSTTSITIPNDVDLFIRAEKTGNFIRLSITTDPKFQVHIANSPTPFVDISALEEMTFDRAGGSSTGSGASVFIETGALDDLNIFADLCNDFRIDAQIQDIPARSFTIDARITNRIKFDVDAVIKAIGDIRCSGENIFEEPFNTVSTWSDEINNFTGEGWATQRIFINGESSSSEELLDSSDNASLNGFSRMSMQPGGFSGNDTAIFKTKYRRKLLSDNGGIGKIRGSKFSVEFEFEQFVKGQGHPVAFNSSGNHVDDDVGAQFWITQSSGGSVLTLRDTTGTSVSSTNLQWASSSDLSEKLFVVAEVDGTNMTYTYYDDAEHTIINAGPLITDISILDTEQLDLEWFILGSNPKGAGTANSTGVVEVDNVKIFSSPCPVALIDANIKLAPIKEFTVDAKLVRIQEFSIDARIRAIKQFTLDVRLVRVSKFDIDSQLSKPVILEFTIDPITIGAQTKGFSLDAGIVTARSFSVNAIFSTIPQPLNFSLVHMQDITPMFGGIFTNSFRIDALLRGRIDFIIDANVTMLARTEVDAFLTTEPQRLNFSLVHMQDITPLFNNTVFETFEVDVLLSTTNLRTFTVDGLQFFSNIETFDIDSILVQTFKVKTFDMDTLLEAENTQDIFVDSRVIEKNQADFFVDTFSIGEFQKTVQIEAFLKGENILKGFSIDARVVQEQTFDITVDSNLLFSGDNGVCNFLPATTTFGTGLEQFIGPITPSHERNVDLLIGQEFTLNNEQLRKVRVLLRASDNPNTITGNSIIDSRIWSNVVEGNLSGETTEAVSVNSINAFEFANDPLPPDLPPGVWTEVEFEYDLNAPFITGTVVIGIFHNVGAGVDDPEGVGVARPVISNSNVIPGEALFRRSANTSFGSADAWQRLLLPNQDMVIDIETLSANDIIDGISRRCPVIDAVLEGPPVERFQIDAILDDAEMFEFFADAFLRRLGVNSICTTAPEQSEKNEIILMNTLDENTRTGITFTEVDRSFHTFSQGQGLNGQEWDDLEFTKPTQVDIFVGLGGGTENNEGEESGTAEVVFLTRDNTANPPPSTKYNFDGTEESIDSVNTFRGNLFTKEESVALETVDSDDFTFIEDRDDVREQAVRTRFTFDPDLTPFVSGKAFIGSILFTNFGEVPFNCFFAGPNYQCEWSSGGFQVGFRRSVATSGGDPFNGLGFLTRQVKFQRQHDPAEAASSNEFRTAFLPTFGSFPTEAPPSHYDWEAKILGVKQSDGIQPISTGSATCLAIDACIDGLGTKERFIVDAILDQGVAVFEVDAVTLLAPGKTYVLDSILLGDQQEIFSISSIINITKIAPKFNLKAILQLQGETETFSIDATLNFQDKTKIFKVDGLRIIGPSRLSLLDAGIKAFGQNVFPRADAVLLLEGVETFEIDALITNPSFQQGKFYTINARVTDLNIKQETFDITATLATLASQEFTIDGIILKENHRFQTDAILRKTQQRFVFPDAILSSTFTKTTIPDALIEGIESETFTVDGIIKLTSVKLFLIDGVTAERNEGEFTVDARFKGSTPEDFFIDSILGRVSQATYNMILQALGDGDIGTGNNGGTNPFAVDPIVEQTTGGFFFGLPIGTLVGQRLRLPTAPVRVTSFTVTMFRSGASGSPTGTLTGKVYKNSIAGTPIIVGDLIATSDNIINVADLTTNNAGQEVTFTFTNPEEITVDDNAFVGFDINGSNEQTFIETETTGTVIPGGDLNVELVAGEWGADVGIDLKITINIDDTPRQRASSLMSSFVGRFIKEFTVDALLIAPLTISTETFIVDASVTGPATKTFGVSALLRGRSFSISAFVGDVFEVVLDVESVIAGNRFTTGFESVVQ